ncbi:MAG: hypothetical protein M3Y04_05110, partial [Actinomycetota bacterium]|nr:hypothetical protein [Actinomycetota bacterium]
MTQLGLVAALTLTACATSASAPTATESAFCGGVVALDGVSSPGGPQDPTPAEMRTYAGQVAAPIRDLQSNSPARIAGPVGAVVAGIDKAKSGDTAALGDDYGAARASVEGWVFDHC